MSHVLLIDDDEQFRAMLEQMLTQALQTKPDLVITDMLMPRKDGVETIIALSRAGLTMPIIAMSGGRRSVTAEFNLNSAEMMGVKVTLPKPFGRVDLRAAITRAMRP